MKTICLCAIFRNESRNVRRCLDALKPVVDFVSICDTGSTDDTPALIEAWGRDNGVPARVHHHPFRDFGHNRSLSFELARSAFPEADYVLLLDADMVLRIEPGWDKQALEADQYLFRQVNSTLEYWNTRLVRAALPWRCVGVTHEYWECLTPHARENLDTLWIDDRGDGGCKADKLERDRRLIVAAIDDAGTPDALRARYLFYLAQTCRDAGDVVAAHDYYGQRVEAGGWPEEIYVAQCERASLAIVLGRPHAEILAEHLKAYAQRPCRAEALWLLSRYCRARRLHDEGYLFANTGKDIVFPAGDILFIRRDVYEWRLLDEFAICAHWTGRYREAVEAGTRILREALFPPFENARLRENLRFSAEKLASASGDIPS